MISIETFLKIFIPELVFVIIFCVAIYYDTVSYYKKVVYRKEKPEKKTFLEEYNERHGL